MLKSLSAFLLVFWLLSVTVHAHVLAPVFGMGAVALFATDLVLSLLRQNRRTARIRREQFFTSIQ